jgi:serine/threonine protein phosphatase PrpC
MQAPAAAQVDYTLEPPWPKTREEAKALFDKIADDGRYSTTFLTELCAVANGKPFPSDEPVLPDTKQPVATAAPVAVAVAPAASLSAEAIDTLDLLAILKDVPVYKTEAELEALKKKDLERMRDAIIVLTSGTHSNPGPRGHMEDIVCVHESLTPTLAFYGVFDGHGGKECVQHVAKRLPVHVFEYLSSFAPSASLSDALLSAFATTEAEWVAEYAKTRCTAGSTAVVLLIDKCTGEFCTAHVGDSRALWIRAGGNVVEQLTIDHKPTQPSEHARIIKEGGIVCNGRLLASLAVSRAFGDEDFKTVADSKNALTALPELKSGVATAGSYFVLASDGLFDVLNNEVVCAVIRDSMVLQRQPARIAEALVDAAIERKTRDNVSVVVVCVAAAKQ